VSSLSILCELYIYIYIYIYSSKWEHKTILQHDFLFAELNWVYYGIYDG